MAATTFAPAAFPFVTTTTAPAMPLAAALPTTYAVATEAPGARAIEVAAMFGDSVIGVKHCVNPRGGTVTRKTWGFVAGGVACLLASAAAFSSAVHTQSRNAEALQTAIAHKAPVWSVRPEAIGTGTSAVAFGGLALAIGALATGLARSRREKQRPGYRIGTAAGVEHAMDSAPAADFPLVAASGDDFVFNFGAGMDGEMTVNGTTTPLAALVAAGHARPSRAVAGALELPIPTAAKIRARAGKTTFLVSAMAAPAAAATATFRPFESRVAKYVAGSLAVHLGIWAVLQQMPVEDSGGSIELSSIESVSTRSMTSSLDDQAMQQPTDTGEETGSESSESQGGSMALASGTAGRPELTGATGRTHVKSRDNLPPALERQQAIEAATSAGVLGSTRAIEESIGVITGSDDMSVGFDPDNAYNGTVDGPGGTHGNFGGGVDGNGPGGGCGFGITDCRGIGSGRYHTIGNGTKAGDEFTAGPGHDGLKPRHGGPPTVAIHEGTVCGGAEGCGYDKALIRRYIKRSIAKVQYCYEKELLANPALAGTVSVQFLIAADGTVQSSTGSGMNTEVASCVANVVKNISFPASTSGGAVQVNYPFVFRAATH